MGILEGNMSRIYYINIMMWRQWMEQWITNVSTALTGGTAFLLSLFSIRNELHPSSWQSD
jgi:hypothetical protein